MNKINEKNVESSAIDKQMIPVLICVHNDIFMKRIYMLVKAGKDKSGLMIPYSKVKDNGINFINELYSLYLCTLSKIREYKYDEIFKNKYDMSVIIINDINNLSPMSFNDFREFIKPHLNEWFSKYFDLSSVANMKKKFPEHQEIVKMIDKDFEFVG